MEKFFKTALLVAAAAMSFTACSTDDTETEAVDRNVPTFATKTLTVTADLTRTTLSDDRTNLVWSNGDQFGAFADTQTTTGLCSSVSTDGVFTLEGVATNAKTIYAYYPYNADAKNAEEFALNIATQQTQDEPGVLNGDRLPMVATGAIEGEQVSLTFKPQACVLALNIYGGNTSETVTNVRFLSKTKPSGSATLDLTAETLSYAGSAYEASVSLTEGFNPKETKPSETKSYENQVYLIVAKKSYADITFVVTTRDTEGKLHNYTMTANSSSTSSTALDCSEIDTITVNLNLSNSLVSTLEDGDYVLLVQDTATYYAVSAENNGSSDRRERVEIVDYNGEAEYETTDENLIWTIQNTVGGYTVKNGENYMTGDSSKAPLKTDAEVLVITKDGIIKSANYFENQLAMNGSYGHAFYKSSSNYSLIPVQENSRERLATPTEGEKETGSDSATVKWTAVENADSYTVTLKGLDTEVTKTVKVTGTGTEATFEKLEIDEYEVTVVANPSEGSTTYRESLPLTLSFQIYAADASFYTMITTTEEFEAALDENGSGQFVITSTLANEKYYVLPTTGISGGKLTGTEITVSENKILSTTAEKYLWTITRTSETSETDGVYYTLSNSESYLYHSSSNSTNIALGNTSLYYWEISLRDNTSEFLLTSTNISSSTSTKRALIYRSGTYNTFCAYATNNLNTSPDEYHALYLFAKAKDNE